MRKRARLIVPLVVLLVAALAAAYWFADPFGRRTAPKARPELPFLELEAAVAWHITSGWEIAAAPRLPGPYRRSREGGSVLGGGVGGRSMTSRVRDAGTVTEELRVESDPKFDQLVVWLETASGDRTLVVMRRPRPQ